MSAPDERELRAWAYLSAVAEPPCAPLIALVDGYGAEEAARMLRSRTVPAPHRAVLPLTEARYATDTAAADLETVAARGGRLVTPAHDEWPGWGLLALDRASSAARGGGPLALWVRGPRGLDAVAQAAIGVVGARSATSYGEYVAGHLAGGIAAKGWAVVSGGAYGVDGAAHRGALAAGGTTAAVLACGIDRDYPAGHAQLLAEIGRSGAVVSEYAPGTAAAKHRFLTRNRLVTALSAALIVVEAGKRSGAANTAAWARNLGRPLGAVPGAITSAMSVGCHQMIADGEAVLVAGAEAVLALAEPDGHDTHVKSPPRPTDRLTAEQFRVIEALPGTGALRLDEVAFLAGLPVGVVRAALAHLELHGLVDCAAGSWSLIRGG